jgi:hypothetical protein
MLIRKKPNRPHALGEPLLHENHKRPVTRREMMAAGLLSGPAMVYAPAWLSALLQPGRANAALSSDVQTAATACGLVSASGNAKHIPVIVFDLAGGANLLGSEALIGVQGGQQNFLSTAGYGKLGVPGSMVPTSSTFISSALGLLWHSDGAILRGIQSVAAAGTQAGVNGMVFAAQSQNDTGNNPHNPMYALAKVLDSKNTSMLKGSLLTLIGTQSTVSGGNSVAPTMYIDPALQPTKIAQPSDATSVDPVQVAIMESQLRISGGTSTATNPVLANTTLIAGGDATLKKNIQCAYTSSVFSVDSFSVNVLDPTTDTNITNGIFTAAQMKSDNDIMKTATVMKLVVSGLAGAGTISLGGFDYHDSTRATGEQRNFKAGQMIGAVLEYAARLKTPVMVYVFSDGSLSASSMVDNSTNGRGKLAWQGDNQSTAGTFMLVYSPNGRAALRNGAAGQQIGYFSPDGAVVNTSAPSANAVPQLVEAVVLNYMGLLGLDSQFTTLFPKQGLGANLAPLTCFAPIV